MAMADRIALLDAGAIAQVGTPRELYDAPRSAAVAGFFGAREWLPGERRGEAVRVGEVEVPAWAVAEAPASGRCTLAFRASDAQIAAQGIAGVVEDAAWRGATERLVVRVGEARVRIEGSAIGAVPGQLVHIGLRRAFVLPDSVLP
jgi:2-aminoethylphosphonate transport system ATP-binding protein